MSEVWKRQRDFLFALMLSIGFYSLAGLISGLAGGGRVYDLVLGMAMFQACLATVRGWK